MKRSSRGRQSLSVAAKKGFALRLYGCLVKECGSFENFKRLLREKRARVRESTVRGWLPPLTRLNLDPVEGTRVLKRDWEAIRSPDFASVAEIGELLNVSVDYLLGLSVPMRLTDRQHIGELSSTLVGHLVAEYWRRRADSDLQVIDHVMAEALDGIYRPWSLHAIEQMTIDTEAALKRVEDRVFSTAERLQEERIAAEASALSERTFNVAERIRTLIAESSGSRRQELSKLLDEVAHVAIDPDRLSAEAWLNAIEFELQLADGEAHQSA